MAERQYAIRDERTKWVLSVHATRAFAEARLASYVTGILEGSPESLQGIKERLAPGSAIQDLCPQLRIVGVPLGVGARQVYRGKVWVKKAKTAAKRAG